MNGQRYDSIRRIWIERALTWRRVPLPTTSDRALLTRGQLTSEKVIERPKEKGE